MNSDLYLENLISKMKRDMKELEDQAAASARTAQSEKEHSLQLEKDLKILSAELEQVKKESEVAKKTALKAHNELKAVYDTCRKGIGAMCQHIFGKLCLCLLLLCTVLKYYQLILTDLFLQGLILKSSSCPLASNCMRCWTTVMGYKREPVQW